MLDVKSDCYRSTVRQLEETFGFLSSSRKLDITPQTDFIKLHRITRGFYGSYFADIFTDYVPLYHSLWKLRLKDASKLENTHQDGGIYYFSAKGYRSRMITLWTNIYRDYIPGLSDSDMGLFVVDNKPPGNQRLYDRLEAADTHFFLKRSEQLADNTYIGGKLIKWDLSKLVKTYFDYCPGTNVCFNSHLLHGSKPLSDDLSHRSEIELNKFRVSLTSVWLHRDDVAWSVVTCSERDYENVYLSRIDKSMWPGVKRAFAHACTKEADRLTNISALVKEHIGG
jgi:hypothetical protein